MKLTHPSMAEQIVNPISDLDHSSQKPQLEKWVIAWHQMKPLITG